MSDNNFGLSCCKRWMQPTTTDCGVPAEKNASAREFGVLTTSNWLPVTVALKVAEVRQHPAQRRSNDSLGRRGGHQYASRCVVKSKVVLHHKASARVADHHRASRQAGGDRGAPSTIGQRTRRHLILDIGMSPSSRRLIANAR